MSGRVLLLDFDGTVCVGDGPVLRYAHEVGLLLGAPAAADLLAGVEDFLAGRPCDATARDAYQLVRELGTGHGLPAADMGRAFLSSRDALVAGEVDVAAPAGLADLLGSLTGVHVVLVTNSPRAGLDVLVDRLGLGGVVHELVGDAGKPAGLGPVLERLLTEHGLTATPWRLLSVGDLWVNDLREPAARGCATAYIDRFGFRSGPADATAATFEELYDAVRAWAGDAAAFAGAGLGGAVRGAV